MERSWRIGVMLGLGGVLLLAGPARTQPPAAKDAPKSAAEEAQKEKAKEQAAKHAEELEKKANKLTRLDYLTKPGAPRKVEIDHVAKPLKFTTPSTQTMRTFDEMRKGKKPIEQGLIDEVAKFHVYRMTKRGEESGISKQRDEIFEVLNTARDGAGRRQEAFIRAYKGAIIKYAKDLFDNCVVVQVNAAILLMQMITGDKAQDDPTTVNAFLYLLEKPNTKEGVYWIALRGLVHAKRSELTSVKQEREAIKLILALVDRLPDIQPELLDQVCVTFGELGWAYAGDQPNKAEVALFLAKVGSNLSKPVRVRVVAANALGRLKTTEVAGWNYPLQATIVGRAILDLALDLQIRDAYKKVWMADFFESMVVIVKNFPPSKELGNLTARVVESVVKNAQPDLANLEDHLDDHPPKSLKIASGTPEINYPWKRAEAQ